MEQIVGREFIRVTSQWRLFKYNKGSEQRLIYGESLNRHDLFADTVLIHKKHNVLLYQGATILITGFTGIGSAFTAYDNSNAIIRIGDDQTGESASQTDLLGTDFSLSMDASYPQYVGANNNAVVFRGTAADGVGEQAWNEFGLENGTTLMNRKVEPSGTKQSGQTWIAEVTYTFA